MGDAWEVHSGGFLRQQVFYKSVTDFQMKYNLPSWCDRVLWKSYPLVHVVCQSYGESAQRAVTGWEVTLSLPGAPPLAPPPRMGESPA